jgi:hypothetical protein
VAVGDGETIGVALGGGVRLRVAGRLGAAVSVRATDVRAAAAGG